MKISSSSSSTSRRLKKGAWTAEEDMLLRKCIEKHGEGKWHQVPLKAGLNRCRKSCRLRWLNYLRPNIKRGDFGEDEVDLIIRLHKLLGNRWSLIAGRIPGRTANDVKNYWNTHLHKKASSSPLQIKKPEELTREKTTTTTTIIKPRARTFSNSLNQFPGNNNVGNETRARENCIVNDKQTPATISDWINNCWADLLDENLLEEKEADSDRQVGWAGGGVTAAEREEEKTNHQDGWCDFSIDWDLLDGLNIDQPFV